MPVSVGQKAPDFTLADTEKKPRTLSEFIGKKTVLAFYPGAFTGPCTKEMCALRDSIPRFNEMNAHIVGISVDAPFANKEFAVKNNVQFPLLSDYTRTVCRQYAGIHEDFAGLNGYTASKRAVFILDKSGFVRYSWISENPAVEPPYDEVSKALAIAN